MDLTLIAPSDGDFSCAVYKFAYYYYYLDYFQLIRSVARFLCGSWASYVTATYRDALEINPAKLSFNSHSHMHTYLYSEQQQHHRVANKRP